MATVAVFIALGTSAYAASTLDKNEVKSKHIKAGAVKNADLADNAVTSPKVANGTLLGEDFAAGQLPTGVRGATGPQGPQGEPGLQGAAGATSVRVRVGATVDCTVEGCETASLATCQAGERAVGGGGAASFRDDITVSIPVPGGAGDVPTGWQASVSEEQGDDNNVANIKAWVVCVSP